MVRVSNKRKHPRYDGSGIWARVKIDGVLTEAQIDNVSLGGALLGLRYFTPIGKNVLLDIRAAQRDLRLVGRVVGTIPRGRQRSLHALHGARVRFNTPSKSTEDALFALIRGMPADTTCGRSRTDPEAFEFHELKLDDTFDIDVEGEEPTMRSTG